MCFKDAVRALCSMHSPQALPLGMLVPEFSSQAAIHNRWEVDGMTVLQ